MLASHNLHFATNTKALPGGNASLRGLKTVAIILHLFLKGGFSYVAVTGENTESLPSLLRC
jgi:hypothetical protein